MSPDTFTLVYNELYQWYNLDNYFSGADKMEIKNKLRSFLESQQKFIKEYETALKKINDN